MVYVCTEDDNGKLVWMDQDKSTRLIADRKAEEDRKAQEVAAAQEAERQRVADEAAAAEAQRQAAEAPIKHQYVAPAPAPVAPAVPAPAAPAPASVYYPNCTAARTAGGAPVYAGGPGYGPHLDRDGDGVGCE